ncbi:MAG TPA: lysoplasmalogenase, partial [Corynebacterium variabile]|nr:lysoplasmalogenase [Corynebacterium variabile]
MRSAYLAAGAVSVVAAAAGRRGDRLTRIVKPTLMPLLAGTVLARGQRKATTTG